MNKKTIILISVAALIILMFGYALYSTRSKPAQTAVVETTAEQKIILTEEDKARAESGKRILTLLDNLEKAKIDATVFDSDVFKSLKDFSQKLPPAEKGRTNPFAPLSVSASAPVVPVVEKTVTPAAPAKVSSPTPPAVPSLPEW